MKPTDTSVCAGNDDLADSPVEHATSAPAAVSWNAFLSTYLPALVLALGVGIALPALPAIAASFHVGFAAASGIVTAFLLGNLAGTLPSGWLIDRYGRRPVLIGGPLLTAVTASLVVVTHSFTTLLILRFLNGCATQMWLMSRLAAISENAPLSQRGRQVSWMFGMDNTGKLAGPVAGGFIAAAWGARAPFGAYAVLALLALLPALIFSRGISSGKASRPNHSQKSPKVTLRQIVMSRLPYFGVALFAGLTRGPVQADLLHLYAAYAYRLGPREIGYLATAAAALTWPIGFLAGWMMDRFGRKRTMVPGFVGVAVSMTALGVAAYLGLGLVWYVGLFLIGVALQALTSGSVQTIGTDVAPAEARGKFLGIWRFCGQAGASLSPVAFAMLAANVGYSSAFVSIALSAVVVAYLLVRHIPETRM
jgi:MFS family permease